LISMGKRDRIPRLPIQGNLFGRPEVSFDTTL
jgi:hypothetical protein